MPTTHIILLYQKIAERYDFKKVKEKSLEL